MDLVKATLAAHPRDSVIAFKDNSSAVRGYEIATLMPERPGAPSPLARRKATYHVIFTAETHNFPTGVAPFPGAETGTGGRIRDVQGTGRGGFVVAGTAAYCVGNLLIPGYGLPWEEDLPRPGNIATLLPEQPGAPSPLARREATYHVIFTAETHNFPTRVAPFPGAETGTGVPDTSLHTAVGAQVSAATQPDADAGLPQTSHGLEPQESIHRHLQQQPAVHTSLNIGAAIGPRLISNGDLMCKFNYDAPNNRSKSPNGSKSPK